MAYFPNGTAGDIFEEKWCSRCIHRGPDEGPGCPVMAAHMLYNYDAIKQEQDSKLPQLRETLDILIPEKDGFPDRCAMFIESAKVHKGPLPDHLKAWGEKQGVIEIKL